MKKSLGSIICASILAFAFAAVPFFSVSAASNTKLKVGDEDLFVNSGTQSTAEEDATYSASTKTLTLKGVKNVAIDTDITNLKITVSKDSTITSITSTGNVSISGTKTLTITNNVSISGTSFKIDDKLCNSASVKPVQVSGKWVLSADGKTATTKSVKFSSDLCTATPNTEAKTNPDTADPVLYYVVALVLASSILVARRYIAKR